MRALACVCVLVAGCSVAPAGTDAGETVGDAGTDAAADAADAVDAAAVRDGGTIAVECMWWGYGTPCPVACSSAPDVVFAVTPHWYGNGYCCGGLPGGGSTDCVCVNGQASCSEYPSDPMPGPPTSHCEFCGVGDAAVYDAGAPDDAGADDGAVDAR